MKKGRKDKIPTAGKNGGMVGKKTPRKNSSSEAKIMAKDWVTFGGKPLSVGDTVIFTDTPKDSYSRDWSNEAKEHKEDGEKGLISGEEVIINRFDNCGWECFIYVVRPAEKDIPWYSAHCFCLVPSLIKRKE